MRATPEKRCRDGFSLVEVNLAILLVALGMVTIFGLFPAGLREGELAATDTQAAMFSDFVLNALRANASTMTNWYDWRSMVGPHLPPHTPPYPLFSEAVVANINPDKFGDSFDPNGSVPLVIQDPNHPPLGGIAVSGPVKFAGNYVNYILEVGGYDWRDPGTPDLHWRSVSLWVLSGQYVTRDVGMFKSAAKFFYTEFYFPGGTL